MHTRNIQKVFLECESTFQIFHKKINSVTEKPDFIITIIIFYSWKLQDTYESVIFGVNK